MSELAPAFRQQFFDNNGVPLSGGKVYSYIAGTTTPLATYTDETGNTPNTNPVILDSSGTAPIWMANASYKFVLEDSLGNVIETVDEVLSTAGKIAAAVNVAGALDILNNLSDVNNAQTSLNNLVGAQTTGTYLRSNGTNVSLTAIQAADVPTLNQSTTGNAATATNATSATTAGSVTGTNVITNSNLSQMSGNTIKGNNTGSTANAADLTVSQVNTMLGTLSNPMTTAGDIIYGGSSGTPARLATASGVLVGGSTPSYSTAPTLTGTNFSNIPLAGLASAAYATAATASTLAERDTNANLTANNFIEGFTTTATAAGTTTMTVGSTYAQYWTGTTTQTVTLPTTSVVAGQQYLIENRSTGVVTVQSSGANTIKAMAASTQLLVTALVATPTTAANWDSVYSAITTVPAGLGGTGVTSVTTTPAASSFAGWDANKNLSANAMISGFTTTATAAGTTTMTIASTQTQFWTGTTTQTIKLPTTSIAAGMEYFIENRSTGVVTVQSSGADTIATLSSNTGAVFTALVATPTTAANWDFVFTPSIAGSSSGNVWTSNGTSSAPTWQASGSSPTGSYASAYMSNASYWTTTSATYTDPTNTGGNTLTSRVSSGITLTAAASSLPGVTFTPASSSAVYFVIVKSSLYNYNAEDGVAAQLTDGTNAIDSSGLFLQEVNAPEVSVPLTLSGIYAPGTTSPVTIKVQLAVTSGSTGQLNGWNGASVAPTAIEFNIFRIF